MKTILLNALPAILILATGCTTSHLEHKENAMEPISYNATLDMDFDESPQILLYPICPGCLPIFLYQILVGHHLVKVVFPLSQLFCMHLIEYRAASMT